MLCLLWGPYSEVLKCKYWEDPSSPIQEWCLQQCKNNCLSSLFPPLPPLWMIQIWLSGAWEGRAIALHMAQLGLIPSTLIWSHELQGMISESRSNAWAPPGAAQKQKEKQMTLTSRKCPYWFTFCVFYSPSTLWWYFFVFLGHTQKGSGFTPSSALRIHSSRCAQDFMEGQGLNRVSHMQR